MKPLFTYEHKKHPLLPLRQFYRRIITNSIIALTVIVISLLIGIGGYIGFGHLSFVDALENAAMILGGMGPVAEMPNDTSKYFAAFYALFSGITFLSTIAVLLAPVLHRALHKFHLQTEEDVDQRKEKR